MMRIAGILTGAALAVAVLIVTIGIPQFVTPEETAVAEPIILPLNREPPVAPEPVAPPSPAAQTGAPQAVDGAPVAPVAETPPVPPEPDDADEEIAAAPAIPPELADDEALRWYAFWSPFRSQLAADGFVTQLQRVTGLDYRVVKVKGGIYEVAFAYSDDDELQANLSQISAATGLAMPEG